MVGAKATVRVKSKEPLERLTQRVQEALSTPPFRFDSDRDPPHAITAMTECLGFEIWLRAASATNAQEYVMTIESSMDVRDRTHAAIADVSEWLSKHIGLVTDLDCEPFPANAKKG